MKKNVNQLNWYFLWIVLFPPLHVGDRVVRGPDWQWGAQGNNEEGIVVHIKDWKGIPNCGVSVQWDNGDKNMYRYGADNCYDDVMDAYPMRKADYQPIYGLNDSAESIKWIIELCIAYWSRYVNHYIRHGLYKSKGSLIVYIPLPLILLELYLHHLYDDESSLYRPIILPLVNLNQYLFLNIFGL